MIQKKLWKSFALVSALAFVTIAASGCAAPTDEEASEEGDDTNGDSEIEPEKVDSTSSELKSGECTVHVMYPKIGRYGISVASNAWGNCRNAKNSSLHFMMRTYGWGGWSHSRSQNRGWKFSQNVPDNNSYNLGGRQVSTAAISKVYVEATVCWTEKIRRCRSDNALLEYLN